MNEGSPLLRASGGGKLGVVGRVTLACIAALFLAGLAAGLLMAYAAAPAAPSDHQSAVLRWGSCALWLNNSVGGFAGSPNVFTGGCATMHFCRRRAGGLGYRQGMSDSVPSAADTIVASTVRLITRVFSRRTFLQQSDDDCTSPGPTMRFESGLTYGVIFCVDPDAPASNLHLHGLHIAGTGNADDVTREAVPGECIFYQYEIYADHMGGTHHYHAHIHGSTAQQVAAGAYGLITNEDQPRTALFAQQPLTAALDGPYSLLTSKDREKQMVAVYNPSTRIWSNALGSNHTFYFVPGEWYRMRIIAVNVNGRASSFGFPVNASCVAYILAYDGVFRFSVPRRDPVLSFPLTGASRIDVAIQCNASGGVFTVAGQPVGTVSIVSDAQLASPSASPFLPNGSSWLSYRPSYLLDQRNLSCSTSVCQTFNVTITPTTVNGVSFNGLCPFHNENGENFEFATLNEWTLFSTNAHPFHLHLYHQQIVSPGGCGLAHENGEYYDTISSPTTCLVRFNTLTHAARVMLHCHVLAHEDAGAMGWIHVIPDGNVTYGIEPCCQIGRTCTVPCVSLPPDNCTAAPQTMMHQKR